MVTTAITNTGEEVPLKAVLLSSAAIVCAYLGAFIGVAISISSDQTIRAALLDPESQKIMRQNAIYGAAVGFLAVAGFWLAMMPKCGVSSYFSTKFRSNFFAARVHHDVNMDTMEEAPIPPSLSCQSE